MEKEQENDFIISEDEVEIEENELTTFSYISNHLCFEYFVGYEVAALLGYANTAKVVLNNVSKCNQLPFREYPGIKEPELNPKTILITRDGVVEMVLKTRKRLSPDVLYILKKFNIDTTNKKCLTKEQQTLSAITNAFKTEKFEDQFKVDNYYIDLYFPEYKIVVECDVNGHQDRKPWKERERMDYINEKLGIGEENWIRYNPDERDFDISKVIGKIYIKMKENFEYKEKEKSFYELSMEEKLNAVLPKYIIRKEYLLKNKESPSGQRYCRGWCNDYKLISDFTKNSISKLTICIDCENKLKFIETKIKNKELKIEDIKDDLNLISIKENERFCNNCKTSKTQNEFEKKRNICRKCKEKIRTEKDNKFYNIIEDEILIIKNLCEDEKLKKLNQYKKTEIHKIAEYLKILQKSTDRKADMIIKIYKFLILI